MFVVSLIGRYAEEASAFDMPKTAGESAIQFGTHREATEEEVRKAGFILESGPTEASPEQLPAGYSLKLDNGGQALFFTDDAGVETEIGFYANSAAARSAAHDFAEKAAALVKPVQTMKSKTKASEPAPAPAPVEPEVK